MENLQTESSSIVTSLTDLGYLGGIKIGMSLAISHKKEDSSCMVLSRNDSRILFGNKQGTISVWDFKERRGLALLATPTLGNLFKYLIYDQEHITCLEPVQGGRRVLVGGSSGVLYEWRMDHYKLIWKNKKAHKKFITNISNLKDKYFITSSDDMTIKVWSQLTKRVLWIYELKEIKTTSFLELYPVGVKFLATRPNSSTFFSTHTNGILAYWSISNRNFVSKIFADASSKIMTCI